MAALVVARFFPDSPLVPSTLSSFLRLSPVSTAEEESDRHLRLGLLGAMVALMTWGGLYFPSTLLRRPHPAFWRTVLSLGVLYSLFLVFLVFQDIRMPRRVVKWLDPGLPDVLPERAYAEDCRLYTEENWLYFGGSLDIFVTAHFLGYILKTIILRDWRIVTCVSIGFELLEITFQHVLPNFLECWWDHLLLDVLLCNGGGTLVGVLLLKWAHAKQYKFISKTREGGGDGEGRGGRKGRTAPSSSPSLVSQLFPEQVELYDWSIFQGPKRFASALVVVGFVLVQDMNTFTSKAMLSLEPKHPLVTARMGLWALLSIPAVREYYEITVGGGGASKVGATLCVTMGGMAVESVLLVRMIYEGGYFREPRMPLYVSVPWIITLVSFSLWVLLYFSVVLPAKQRWMNSKKACARSNSSASKNKNSCRSCAYAVYLLASLTVNPLFYLSLGAMVAMFFMGLPDLQWGRREFEAALETFLPEVVAVLKP